MKNKFVFSLIVFGSLWLVKCRTSEIATKAEAPKVPANFKPFESETLISAGRSRSAQFSPDGTRLLFVSSNRPQHRNPQAYELKLDGLKERRITFQDGDIGNVIYSTNGSDFIYTSTTDEAKEDPDLIRKVRNDSIKNDPAKIAKLPLADQQVLGRPLPRSEIYESASDGSYIERITNQPGFDGNLTPREGGFTFASVRNNNFDLYSFNVRTKSTQKLTSTPGYEWSGLMSPDANWIATVVIAENLQTSTIEVMPAKSRTGLVSFVLKNISLDPTWYPGNEWLLFSSNSDDPLNYELYWIRRDGNCLTRATYTAESEMNPVFSRDGKQLVFTLVNGDKSTLQRVKDIKPPTCTETMSKEKK